MNLISCIIFIKLNSYKEIKFIFIQYILKYKKINF